MKNKFSSNALCVRAVALAFGVLCLSLAAHASSDNLGVLSAKVSLLSKPSIVQGEPIVLRYSVQNNSEQKIGVSWGKTDGRVFTLTSQSGATRTIEQKQSSSEGFHVVTDPFMRSGGSYEAYLVVPQKAASLRPGKYVFAVSVQLPYTTTNAGEDNPVKIEKDISDSGDVYTHVFRFPITVTAADDGALRTAATSLLKTISITPYGPKYQADLEALLSLPEAQAAESWRELTDHLTATNTALVADRLGDTGSVKASDLLLKMLDNPTLSPDDSSAIKDKLAEMYNSGTASLRSYLKSAMMQRGVNLPNQVPISQPTD